MLQAQTNSVLLECPHVPALCLRVGLEDGGDGQVGLRGVEIAALSRWHIGNAVGPTALLYRYTAFKKALSRL